MYIIQQKQQIQQKDHYFEQCVRIVLDELSPVIPPGLRVFVYPFEEAVTNPELSGYLGAYFRLDVGEPYDIYEIHICDNIHALLGPDGFSKSFNYRLETVLEAFSIPINNYTIFLLILLHEFGHAYIYHLFRTSDMKREYGALFNFSGAVRTMFSDEKDVELWRNEYKISLPYFVDAVESQADIFAMKNFLPFWRKVRKFAH